MEALTLEELRNDKTVAPMILHRLGYSGPGIWLSVSNHVGPRLSEWSGSFHMLLWGLILLNFPVFSRESFFYFKAIFQSQELLGAILTAFGVLGIIGLVINGMRREVTPWIRLARAFVGFWAFLGMTTCFALSGEISTWAAVYPVLAVAELVNMGRTGYDAGNSNAAK